MPGIEAVKAGGRLVGALAFDAAARKILEGSVKHVRQRIEGVARAQPAYCEVEHLINRTEAKWSFLFERGRPEDSA